MKKSAAPKSASGKKARAAKPTPAAETPAPPKQTSVNITAAKGRPMLSWVGKRPLRHVTAFPAQHVENFNLAGEFASKGGLLFHGDNKEVLAHLLANGFRGEVDMIYIDPPFDSGADYVRKVSLRGPAGKNEIAGEGYALGEQIQYADIWAKDNFLQFMFERLALLKELLAPGGCIYLHCDYRKVHMIRCVMDEVFGADNHLNSLVWMFSTRSSIKTTWKRTHHDILFYKKDNDPVFNWDDEMVREPLSETTIEKYKLEDEDGRKYRLSGRNFHVQILRAAHHITEMAAANVSESCPVWTSLRVPM
ncbi:MAG: DNA methyltransferase [Limisphaerales bacterium]